MTRVTWIIRNSWMLKIISISFRNVSFEITNIEFRLIHVKIDFLKKFEKKSVCNLKDLPILALPLRDLDDTQVFSIVSYNKKRNVTSGYQQYEICNGKISSCLRLDAFQIAVTLP